MRRTGESIEPISAAVREGFGTDASRPGDRPGEGKVGDEASSARRPILTEAPASWLDRLLVVSTTLPHADGEEAVIGAFCDALVGILEGSAVGVCLPRNEGEQLVIKRVAAGQAPRQVGVDPTRLFPAYAFERVAEIPEAEGATLHIAGDDPILVEDPGPVGHLTRRAARVLGSAIVHARTYADYQAIRQELRTAQAQAIQTDKLASFGQIAAGLVHELNNPLTSIIAYSDYLIKKATLRGEKDSDDAERLRRIGASADRMLRFARDLVSYARPSSEISVPVGLHMVIDQALAFCEHVMAETGTVVERRFSAEPFMVRGKPEQIAQIFVNLVTNACHAMPSRGGRIIVTTEAIDQHRHVCITVEDDGHGIAPEHLPHVFAPFFTTKGEGRGTGLGLSIVKTIVEHHGGEIRVESALSRGTRFVISLPLIPRA